jgi:hypothetical protein
MNADKEDALPHILKVAEAGRKASGFRQRTR